LEVVRRAARCLNAPVTFTLGITLDLDRVLANVERVVNLIRPKFYNRLTWAVVLAGLLLLSTPWWSDLVVAVAAKYLSVKLPEPDSHLGWGLGLVALGLVYHAFVHYVGELASSQKSSQALADQEAHDRRTFEELVRIVSEEDLAWILNDLQNQHAYVSAQGRKLDDAVRHLLAPATQFIDRQVQGAAQTFGISLRDLRNWTALNFFVHGASQEDGGHRFCLYPDLNPDLGMPTNEESVRYHRFAEQLYGKVDDVNEKYGHFRSTVKRVLAL
jgi:hypothetical protein